MCVELGYQLKWMIVEVFDDYFCGCGLIFIIDLYWVCFWEGCVVGLVQCWGS